jgi:geranylgeranyl reductase family protein
MLKNLQPVDWQYSIDSCSCDLWDVAIIGAGPAGSMAAINLANHGHRVVLIDKDRFPREKICGDGLIADSLQCLQRAGLYETVKAKGYQLQKWELFSTSGVKVEIHLDTITLRRIQLDTLLAQKAVEAGAYFFQGTVNHLQILSNGWVEFNFHEQQRPIRTKVGIIATGAEIELLKNAGMLSCAAPNAVAVRCYVQSDSGPDCLVISFDRSVLPGYGWIFPLGNNLYNVGCGGPFHQRRAGAFNLKDAFQQFCLKFPWARKIMDSGQPLSELRGATLRCGLKGSRLLREGNLIAVGEAVGTTLPLTREGIGGAMESAEIAAAAIHDALISANFSELQRYPREIEEKLRSKHAGFEIGERWLSIGWLNDFIFRRINKSKFLRDAALRVVADAADPRSVFSVSAVLKSLWQ